MTPAADGWLLLVKFLMAFVSVVLGTLMTADWYFGKCRDQINQELARIRQRETEAWQFLMKRGRS